MTRSSIPGSLDLAALAALHGPHRESSRDNDRLQHFERLTQPEREQAIRRMAAEGYSDSQIAHATRLAVEQVRRALAEHSTQQRGIAMNTTTVEHYFGGCPECGGNDGYLNIRSTHICVCDAHLTCWQIGANLFSCWHEENEAIWAKNEAKLNAYRVVDPLPMDAAVPRSRPILTVVRS
jgi:hypothetical protein